MSTTLPVQLHARVALYSWPVGPTTKKQLSGVPGEAVLMAAGVMAVAGAVAGGLGTGSLDVAVRHIRHRHPTSALEEGEPGEPEPGGGSWPRGDAGVGELGAGHETIILSNQCNL